MSIGCSNPATSYPFLDNLKSLQTCFINAMHHDKLSQKARSSAPQAQECAHLDSQTQSCKACLCQDSPMVKLPVCAHHRQHIFQVDSYGKISRQVVHSGFKRHSGQPKAQ
ncbi:TPA: hypothetical protein ACH3X2_002554 [Trebouxia sp. C0005]